MMIGSELLQTLSWKVCRAVEAVNCTLVQKGETQRSPAGTPGPFRSRSWRSVVGLFIPSLSGTTWTKRERLPSYNFCSSSSPSSPSSSEDQHTPPHVGLTPDFAATNSLGLSRFISAQGTWELQGYSV